MASTELLLSRVLDLIRYGQWDQNDVVNLFTALVKQYSVRTEKTDFYTWMSKILYQVEIHKIDKTFFNIEQSQFVEDIEVRIESVKETKEKILKIIIEEMKAEKDIDQDILHEVEDIVLYASLSLSYPVFLHLTNGHDIKSKLVKLCKAVEDTKELRPRLTQMVSWCIMVLSGSSQLIQVGTGEGKSCIVAMFAAYRAMVGQSVDIISSSPVLAKRDAEEWRLFYEELEITVSHNTNTREVEDLGKCYACQVVYGTTQEFAGDWLRHQFQRENVRPGREFQCVIVDEVDSLMLDKGLELVYLNSEMPVMESLNVILAKIWSVVNHFEGLTVKALTHLIRSLLMAEDILPPHTYFENPSDTSNLEHNEFHMPGFLEHVNRRLKIWIENASLAKTMTLGHEYILHEGGVVPVDYSSTGVVQNDMKWGDGLQQFLEMKHQVNLTNMCLITNFMSNVNLFKRYAQIYGLTGTLGSQTELDLLQKLYPGIKTCKIPPFKRRKLYEKNGIVVNDENGWVQTICEVVNKNVNPTVYRGSRAVLIICETIKRAQTVHNALLESIPKDKLKLYTNNNMDNSKVTGKEVTKGCVIVATNLAGRGTDLKICAEVNGSGGLFVIQSFLPLNIRVEQQAFGRTARKGDPGSAQLIMCSTHFSESVKLLTALNSPFSSLLTHLKHLTATVAVSAFIKNEFEETLKICQEDPSEKNCEAMEKELKELLSIVELGGLSNVEEHKRSRDSIVEIRLSQFLENEIPKITKKEELFTKYLNFLEPIYEEEQGGDLQKDIVSSLHECWGMWLLMNFNENESTETLTNQLQKYLQSAKLKLFCNQSPSSMIYHYVRIGNTLRHKGSLEDSIEMYTRAIQDSPCWVAIALYNRALSVLSKESSGHIAKALADLKEAEKAIDSHMKELNLTLIYVKLFGTTPNMISDTLLTKQFKAKHLAQLSLQINIQKAIKVLQVAESQGYDVRITKYPALLLMPILVLLRGDGFIDLDKNIIKELMNLHSLGLDTLFSAETVFSFSKRLRKIFS